MREIKFRGKRICNGEWVYGNLYKYKDSIYILLQESTKQSGSGFFAFGGTDIKITGYYAVIPESVGQYIGLKDKNSKEIYEGDIRGGSFYCGDEEIFFTEVIKWDDGGCYFWEIIKGSKPDFMQTEIIGNIHENKDLLK